MNQPRLVTVIIPCFNGERFLTDAIASIRNQAYMAIEILVVDDGSTDRSAEIAASMGDDIRYVYQQNKGLPGARNTGLRHARGDLITFLDVDDVFADDKIALQAQLLEEDPTLGIVLGYLQKTKLRGYTEGRPIFTPYEEPAPALKMDCAMIGRKVFDTVGTFDESQRYCDDWDWFMRAREAGIGIKTHEDVVAQYRRHDENMTNDVAAGNLHTLQMLKKSLDRRRQQTGGQAQSLPALLKKND